MKLKLMESKFYVNEDKRTVVADVTFFNDLFCSMYTAKGKAVCHQKDEFDIKRGEKIAFLRAKRLIELQVRDDLKQIHKDMEKEQRAVQREIVNLESKMVATKATIDKTVNME